MAPTPIAAQIEELLLIGTSMGGARPKAVVEDEAGLWIAKFNRTDDKWNHARVEHSMLILGRRCGLTTSDSRVVSIGGRDVLFVKRFDREKTKPAYRGRAVASRTADPLRSPRVMTLDVPPPPLPLPPQPRLEFGRRIRRHACPAEPACSGVHSRSVMRFASGFFPTRPRGASVAHLTTDSPACGCLRLTVATNSPREGLAPPIQCPCRAHLPALRHPRASLILIVAALSS